MSLDIPKWHQTLSIKMIIENANGLIEDRRLKNFLLG